MLILMSYYNLPSSPSEAKHNFANLFVVAILKKALLTVSCNLVPRVFSFSCLRHIGKGKDPGDEVGVGYIPASFQSVQGGRERIVGI